jgi:iron complex transport system substrate-binding protein
MVGMTTMPQRARVTLLLIVLASSGVLHVEAGQPARVVSINLCADALVLAVAPRDMIASVTWIASDRTVSPSVEAARGIPVNYGTAEEVVALKPDLVVAVRYSSLSTVALLRRLGHRVLMLELPDSVAAAIAQIHRLAAALGVPERGEALARDLQSRLNTLRPTNLEEPPTAVVLRPNADTAGTGSLVDDLMRRVGLRNLAADIGIGRWGSVPLERLIAEEPDIIVLENDGSDAPAMATAILQHPALRHTRQRAVTMTVPAPQWSCAGPWLAEAAERLAAAREQATDG